MYNPNQAELSKLHSQELHARAAKDALIKEAKAGQTKGNLLQSISKFAHRFSNKAVDQSTDDAQSPNAQLNKKHATS